MAMYCKRVVVKDEYIEEITRYSCTKQFYSRDIAARSNSIRAGHASSSSLSTLRLLSFFIGFSGDGASSFKGSGVGERFLLVAARVLLLESAGADEGAPDEAAAVGGIRPAEGAAAWSRARL